MSKISKIQAWRSHAINAMWYVIQTKSGEEKDLKLFLEHILPESIQASFFVPLYENVWRKGGTGHISLQLMFPGYVFAETDMPEKLFEQLKRTPKFTRMLNMEETDGERTFLTVSGQDEAFLRSLLEDNVMHVSYIRRSKSGRIEKLLGPLAGYEKYITKLDIPHRRAIVEAHIFGKERKIKFGLWTDADPDTPRIRRLKFSELEENKKTEIDIGIYIGDMVRDKSGIYEGMELTVIEIDATRNIVWVEAELFGTKVKIEMDADKIETIDE